MRGYTKYTEEILIPIVKDSVNMAEVLRKLGLKYTGGSHSNLKRMIHKYGIDMSHFTGSAWRKGPVPGGPEKKTPDQILVVRDPLSRPECAFRIRRALLEIGTPYQCAICGLGPEWHGKVLNLQIDHINGIRTDNRRCNLRFICPNCHSQTENFGSKNRRPGGVKVAAFV